MVYIAEVDWILFALQSLSQFEIRDFYFSFLSLLDVRRGQSEVLLVQGKTSNCQTQLTKEKNQASSEGCRAERHAAPLKILEKLEDLSYFSFKSENEIDEISLEFGMGGKY